MLSDSNAPRMCQNHPSRAGDEARATRSSGGGGSLVVTGEERGRRAIGKLIGSEVERAGRWVVG